MANTITAANVAFLLAIPGVTSAATPLVGWFVDEAFDITAVDAAETQVGVDGTGVGGWIPREVPMDISFLASSPSPALFDSWVANQDQLPDVIYASATIRIPAIKISLNMNLGVLKRYSPAPNVRRVLDRRQFVIHWLPAPGVPAITSSPL